MIVFAPICFHCNICKGGYVFTHFRWFIWRITEGKSSCTSSNLQFCYFVGLRKNYWTDFNQTWMGPEKKSKFWCGFSENVIFYFPYLCFMNHLFRLSDRLLLYLHHRGYVFAPFHYFVGYSVYLWASIMQKLRDLSPQNLVEGCGVGQGRTL